MKTKTYPNPFGRFLHAVRLRYRLYKRLNCYIRVYADGPPYILEIIPNTAEALWPVWKIGKGTNPKFAFWWDHEGDAFALTALSRCKEVTRSLIIKVDDEGEITSFEYLDGGPASPKKEKVTRNTQIHSVLVDLKEEE